ncbi:peroxisomal nicotinamide adenine dinucleotide carrier isoform X2 [Physcomitrium patens]|uniref:Peroxisomal nicotinamide adenine dinucleotide carrier n=1 Tax=Physcomitrium patens TaxID=3218 RepID=A0A7I4E2J7_PHYPA|nr:peroxisomal nicotinamide adenine dinucleotide carrier-like isoform X2 [Physcomitrium patens]|eukprot:XP_024377489.1 peroxisomal nicotinamide adenine dinucleotide carrier-like isoform X2 [Physcomitrella patens]
MSDAVVNGLAGAGGGIVAVLLTYPLQAVNTRQQTERTAKRGKVAEDEEGALAFAKAYPTKLQKGTLQEIWEVIKNDGWGGLYRGLLPSLVGTACSQGVYYYFYQIFRSEAEAQARRSKKPNGEDGSVGVLASLFVAALAGCANVLITNPIWVIVTRMQTQKRKKGPTSSTENDLTVQVDGGLPSSAVTNPNFSGSPTKSQLGARDTVKDLYKEAGLLGFWKGVLPTLIMVFLLGAVAKLGATVVTYPLSVVKSRLQAKQDGGGHASLQYAGTLDAITKMVRFEGLAGFYKGMSTKIVQSVVAAAVLFMIKEELVKVARTVVVINQPNCTRLTNSKLDS